MKRYWIIQTIVCLVVTCTITFASDWKKPPQGTILFNGCPAQLYAKNSLYEATFLDNSIKVTVLNKVISDIELARLNVNKMETFEVKGKEGKYFYRNKWGREGGNKQLESYKLSDATRGQYNFNWKRELLSYEVFNNNPKKPTWKIEIMDYKQKTVSPITSRNINDKCPSFSPDGLLLAFYSAISEIHLSNTAENFHDFELLISDARTGKKILAVPLGVFKASDLGAVKWNLNGDKLVFYSDNEKEKGLEILDIMSGNIIKIDTQGVCPDWSPDGKFIAYERSIQEKETNYNEIWIYDVAKNQNIQVTNTRDTSYYCADYIPIWSPDSRYIVFKRSGKPEKEWADSQLWIAEIETLRTQCVDSTITPSYSYKWIPE